MDDLSWILNNNISALMDIDDRRTCNNADHGQTKRKGDRNSYDNR